MFFLQNYFFPCQLSHQQLTILVNYLQKDHNDQYLKQRSGELKMKFRLTLSLYLTYFIASLINTLLPTNSLRQDDSISQTIQFSAILIAIILTMIIEGKYSTYLRQFYFQDIALLIYCALINWQFMCSILDSRRNPLIENKQFLIISCFNVIMLHFTLESIYYVICKVLVIVIGIMLFICFEIEFSYGQAFILEFSLLIQLVLQYQKEVINKISFSSARIQDKKKTEYCKLLESIADFQIIALQHSCSNNQIKSRFRYSGLHTRLDYVEVSVPVPEEFEFEIFFRNENSKQETTNDLTLLNLLTNMKIINNEHHDVHTLSAIIVEIFNKYKNRQGNYTKSYCLINQCSDFLGIYCDDTSIQNTPRGKGRDCLLQKQYEIRTAPCIWDEQFTILVLLKEILTPPGSCQLTGLPSSSSQSQSGTLTQHIFQSVSHELKTPLNGMYLQVQSCLTIIKQEMKRCEVVKEIIEILQDVQHNNFILQSKVNDLLDFKCLETGHFQISRSEFDLQNTLDDLKELFHRQFKEKGVQFKIDCETIPTILYTDEPRLKQVLINFIGNSLKFTFSGFVHLEVKAQKNNLLEFIIADSGIGIPQESSENLFQLTSGRVNKQHGAGLGLTICKQLVCVLGPKQEIQMKSTLQEGTIFSFFVYQTLFKNRESQQYFVPSEGRGKKKILSIQIKHSEKLISTGSNKDIMAYTNIKQEHCYQILIVDDTSINIMALRCLVDRIFTLPHKIDEAYNGIQAVEKVQQQSYDIIFMDVNMPLMDGLEATKIIREIELAQHRKQSTIVVVTAYSDILTKQNSINSGANQHIVKPITQEQIQTLLCDFIKLTK